MTTDRPLAPWTRRAWDVPKSVPDAFRRVRLEAYLTLRLTREIEMEMGERAPYVLKCQCDACLSARRRGDLTR
jgi:hypothetical protein